MWAAGDHDSPCSGATLPIGQRKPLVERRPRTLTAPKWSAAACQAAINRPRSMPDCLRGVSPGGPWLKFAVGPALRWPCDEKCGLEGSRFALLRQLDG